MPHRHNSSIGMMQVLNSKIYRRSVILRLWTLIRLWTLSDSDPENSCYLVRKINFWKHNSTPLLVFFPPSKYSIPNIVLNSIFSKFKLEYICRPFKLLLDNLKNIKKNIKLLKNLFICLSVPLTFNYIFLTVTYLYNFIIFSWILKEHWKL